MDWHATTWQTVGPYFSIGLAHLRVDRLASLDEAGEHVAVEGQVLDGKGMPVPDAVIEIWQANAEGKYPELNDARAEAQRGFRGFGRIPTDAAGRFRFTTIRPGAVAEPDGQMQSPHLAVRIMMRGLLRDLVTRMYFPAEEMTSDPILGLVPEERRGTLIATPAPDRPSTFLWDVVLQGERETVFFDC